MLCSFLAFIRIVCHLWWIYIGLLGRKKMWFFFTSMCNFFTSTNYIFGGKNQNIFCQIRELGCLWALQRLSGSSGCLRVCQRRKSGSSCCLRVCQRKKLGSSCCLWVCQRRKSSRLWVCQRKRSGGSGCLRVCQGRKLSCSCCLWVCQMRESFSRQKGICWCKKIAHGCEKKLHLFTSFKSNIYAPFPHPLMDNLAHTSYHFYYCSVHPPIIV